MLTEEGVLQGCFDRAIALAGYKVTPIPCQQCNFFAEHCTCCCVYLFYLLFEDRLYPGMTLVAASHVPICLAPWGLPYACNTVICEDELATEFLL